MPISKPAARELGPTVHRSVRFPKDLHEQLKSVAEDCSTDFTALVMHFLRYSLEQYETEHGLPSEPKPKAAAGR